MGSGRYAVDTRTNRLGERMGSEGPYVQLRPVGGGREWDCPPGKLREPTEAELKKVVILGTPVDAIGIPRPCRKCHRFTLARVVATREGRLRDAAEIAEEKDRHWREEH
ncbi:hypothetical protein ACPCTO_06520 [Streptomyces olivoreticuli]